MGVRTLVRVTVSAAALTVGAAWAQGQAYNVDVNFYVGGGAYPGSGAFPVPDNSYGGAMGVSGVWNAYPSDGSAPALALRTTANVLTGATVRINNYNNTPNALGAGAQVFPGVQDDYDHLMGDYLQANNPNDWITIAFNGLTPGYYECIVYDSGGRISGQTVNYEQQVTRKSMTLVQNPGYGFMQMGHEYARCGAKVVGAATGTCANCFVVFARANMGTGVPSPVGVQLRRLTRLYVAADAPEAGNDGEGGSGGSWESPLKSLRNALELAAYDTGITEVWVKRGTYVEAGAQDGSLTVPFGVALRGGFAGTETTRFERPLSDDAFYQTVIDGRFGGGANDEAFHVFDQTGPGATAFTLDRLTVRNGKANGSGDLGRGGGLLARDTIGTVTACRFESGEGVSGGGAYIGGGRVAFSDTTFDQNGAGTVWGGAAYVELADAGNVTTFLRCRFTRNTTGTLGGGALWLTGEARLSNCLLAGNTSVGSGGAVSTNSGLPVKIENCTIVNNSSSQAASLGGGVHASGAGPHQLRNCVIWGNTAAGAATVQTRNLNAPATTTFDFCTIHGHAGTAVGGNNGLTPGFADGPGADGVVGTDDDRWGPIAFATMIDSGTTAVLGLISTTDLNGDARYLDDTLVANTGAGTPPIDRGCYERQLSVILVCGPSDIGHTGGVDGPDGALNNNDFIVFIDRFFSGDSRADVGRTGGLAGADGAFNNNDFVVFIDQFFTGC